MVKHRTVAKPSIGSRGYCAHFYSYRSRQYDPSFPPLTSRLVFYVAITDESAATATGSACLCEDVPRAVNRQSSACISFEKASSAAFAPTLNIHFNAAELPQDVGFCRVTKATATTREMKKLPMNCCRSS